MQDLIHLNTEVHNAGKEINAQPFIGMLAISSNHKSLATY